MNNSYATANVTGDGVNLHVGGLVGENGGGKVETSYATSNVTAADAENVAGLVGYNDGGTVAESYAVGPVTGDAGVGGLIGFNGGGTVTESYWDVNTTNQSTSDGGATGLSTDEMLGENADTNMDGFDFTSTWDVVDDETNVSYPFLQDNTQTPAPGLTGVEGAETGGEEDEDENEGEGSSNFELQLEPSDTTVQESDVVKFEVTVTNTGGQSGAEAVSLRVNGTEVDDELVTLVEGATETVTLEWKTEQGEAGEYEAEVGAGNESVEVNVTVEPSGDGDGDDGDNGNDGSGGGNDGDGDNGDGGTGVGTENPFLDSDGNPIDELAVVDKLTSWSEDGELGGVSYTELDVVDFLVEWNEGGV